jgi:drug/metabolite transporter (DMT)-like permease
VAGLAIGLLGVAFLVGVDVGGSDLLAVGEMVIVVICYAFGAALMGHQLGDLPGLGVVTASLVVASLVYLPIALVVPGSLPAAMPSGKVILSVVTLAAVCTVGAFLLMFALVAEIGPVRATTITYVNPAVAIVAGAVVLSEPVTAATGVGFVMVLIGSALVTRRPRALAAELLPPDAAPIVGATILGPSTDVEPGRAGEPDDALGATCGAAAADAR